MELSDYESRFRQIKEKQGRTVKDNTVKNNAKMIKKIVSATRPNVWLNPTIVEEWVSSGDFSNTTRRNYYSLMLAMANWEKEISISGPDSSKELTDTIDAYVKRIKDLEKEINTDKKARKVSNTKKEQQVAPSMVYDIITGMYHNGHDAEALILSILMKIPYRAEVGTLIYMKLMDYKKMVKKVGGIKNLDKNYLVMGSKKMFVSRSDYKTFDTYGTILNDIEDKVLQKTIRKYITKHKVESGSSMFGFTNRQEVSKRLGYLTKKIAGVSLGPAAVVKIMLSNQTFKDMAEVGDFLRESSRIRGTAVNVLQDVYLHKTKLED